MKPAWTGHRIVVESGKERRAGSPNRLVHRGAEPDIPVIGNDANSLTRGYQAAPAIVHDDGLKITPCLPGKRAQTRLQRIVGGEGRYNYSDRRLLQAPILPFEEGSGGRYRTRTYDLVRVKHAL